MADDPSCELIGRWDRSDGAVPTAEPEICTQSHVASLYGNHNIDSLSNKGLVGLVKETHGTDSAGFVCP